LTCLPKLPPSLEVLYCYENQLTCLPDLPADLRVLRCNDNRLALLPEPSFGLQVLHCKRNSFNHNCVQTDTKQKIYIPSLFELAVNRCVQNLDQNMRIPEIREKMDECRECNACKRMALLHSKIIANEKNVPVEYWRCCMCINKL
jgi:hypothetical protein